MWDCACTAIAMLNAAKILRNTWSHREHWGGVEEQPMDGRTFSSPHWDSMIEECEWKWAGAHLPPRMRPTSEWEPFGPTFGSEGQCLQCLESPWWEWRGLGLLERLLLLIQSLLVLPSTSLRHESKASMREPFQFSFASWKAGLVSDFHRQMSLQS